MRSSKMLLAIGGAALLLRAASVSDPLEAGIKRWIAFVQDPATPAQMKEGAGPALARADDALHQGRRLLALQRLASIWANVGAAEYSRAHAKDDFETEWKRNASLAASQKVGPIQPAAIRALAEAAAPQVREYYQASLDYAHSTNPESGLYYLGEAQAQRGFVEFAQTLSQPSGRRAPQLRSLTGELDALEHELLEAYRPPASIDRHGEFIGASSMLKEARELDAVGLRYGALIRYLETERRTAMLTGKPMPRADAAAKLRELSARLERGDTDNTIAQVYVEAAQSDLEDTTKEPASATAIVNAVLPAYFAALEPGKASPKPAVPRATVTLVRWPYT